MEQITSNLGHVITWVLMITGGLFAVAMAIALTVAIFGLLREATRK